MGILYTLSRGVGGGVLHSFHESQQEEFYLHLGEHEHLPALRSDHSPDFSAQVQNGIVREKIPFAGSVVMSWVLSQPVVFCSISSLPYLRSQTFRLQDTSNKTTVVRYKGC